MIYFNRRLPDVVSFSLTAGNVLFKRRKMWTASRLEAELLVKSIFFFRRAKPHKPMFKQGGCSGLWIQICCKTILGDLPVARAALSTLDDELCSNGLNYMLLCWHDCGSELFEVHFCRSLLQDKCIHIDIQWLHRDQWIFLSIKIHNTMCCFPHNFIVNFTT